MALTGAETADVDAESEAGVMGDDRAQRTFVQLTVAGERRHAHDLDPRLHTVDAIAPDGKNQQ